MEVKWSLEVLSSYVSLLSTFTNRHKIWGLEFDLCWRGLWTRFRTCRPFHWSTIKALGLDFKRHILGDWHFKPQMWKSPIINDSQERRSTCNRQWVTPLSEIRSEFGRVWYKGLCGCFFFVGFSLPSYTCNPVVVNVPPLPSTPEYPQSDDRTYRV